MKVNYHIDKFVDNNGVEREFVLAAVSVDLRKNEDIDCLGILYRTDKVNPVVYDIPKILCLGIAVKRPEDTFDEKRGMEIARGKALKALVKPEKGKLIFVSDPGLINTKMVQEVLEQEALYFKRNPSCYIPGYGRKVVKK